MLPKKTLIYILIAVAVLGVFFGIFSKTKAISIEECFDAAGNPLRNAPAECSDPSTWTPGKNLEPLGGPSATLCIPVPGWFSFKGCIFAISYYVLWKPASLFMQLGGLALNKSIELSITKSPLNYLTQSKDSAVSVGWGVARDIVNLLLIFILLYIAISTILQVAGYGAKELLLTLIIIAFLVNFSLVITKLIIDASNVLAVSFYNTFPKGTDGGVKISEVFKTALGLEKIAIAEDAIKKADGGILFLATIFGAAVALIAGFIFLVFAALFFIRMVVLMILMILAPLAFAAHVLPSTQQHASKWWSSLFNQSFFAPAALFMLYLAARIASSGFIENSLGINIKLSSDKGIADILKSFSTKGDPNKGDLVIFAVQYLIIAIVLCASLVIAKQMGAMGAQTAIAGGKKMGKKLQGYAGRISARSGARMIRPVAESKTMQKFAARFPRAGGAALRTLQAGAKAGGLDEITKRRATLGMSLAPKQRADYIAKADERTKQEMWKQMNAKDRAVMMMLRPSSKSVYDRMTDKLPAEEKEKTEKAYKEAERKVLVNELSEVGTSLADFITNLKLLKPDEIKDLKDDVVTDPILGLPKLDAMVDNLTIAHIQKIIDRGDEVTKLFFDSLATLGGSIDDIARNVESRNPSMAAAVRGNPIVKAELQSRGVSP